MKNEDVVKLFDSYADDLYRFAVSYVGSKHDAEDVVQDVFLKLLSKNLLFDRRFEKAYLLTITANKCKDLLKSKARKTSVDLESEEWHLEYYDGFTDSDRAVFDELMALDEMYRVPLHLFYYEDYSITEIAKVLDLPDSTVKTRLKRGRDKLKKTLRKEDWL